MKPKTSRNSNTNTNNKENANISTSTHGTDANNKNPIQPSSPPKDPVKEAPCLFGLSQVEAKEICSKATPGTGGAAALKRELLERKNAYIRVVLYVAPSLGMSHGNPALQAEVWNMLGELPYQDRFKLYGAWRGHAMERMALGQKHPQFVVAEVGRRTVHRCNDY